MKCIVCQAEMEYFYENDIYYCSVYFPNFMKTVKPSHYFAMENYPFSIISNKYYLDISDFANGGKRSIEIYNNSNEDSILTVPDLSVFSSLKLDDIDRTIDTLINFS